MLRDWPLVGRTEEAARILGAVTSGGHVVLAGASGVGKTRLAREMTDTFRDAGFATEWIIGTRAAAAIPFGAVAPLIPRPSGQDTASVSVDTMASIRDAVLTRAGDRELVLIVDDAHCVDDATAALVHQVATRTDTRLLVTLRSGEASPDAVTALWKDGIAERLDLQPLPDDEIRCLLAEALGGPVEERAAWEMIRRCAGNCMFLRELVRATQEAGSFRFEQGRWRLKGELSTSTRLVELVEARTSGLPGASRELLEHLALGEPLPLSTLSTLVGEAVLEDASRLGLVDIDEDPRRTTVRLSHPLYGEALRSGMPALRARARSRALVEAFESAPLRRSDDVVRFASWSLDAGVPAEPELLLRAAQRALEGADLRATERFAAAAVDQLTAAASGIDGEPDDDLIELQTRAILTLVEVLGRQRRFDAASAVLDRVHPRAPEELAAEVVEMRSRALFLGADDLDGALAYLHGREQPAHMARALEVLQEAESRFPGRTTRLRLRLARARLLHNLARPRDAVELLDRTETPTVELEHRWLTVRGPALAFMGRFDDADAAIARGLSLPDANLVANAISWIPTTVAMNALGRSQLPSLESMMRGAVDRARSLRHPAMQRSAATVLGWTLLQQGRITEAIELLIVGTDDNAELDYQGMLLLAFGGLATAYALAGDTAAAQATLDQADREVRTPIRICDPAIAVGHAFTARAQGLPAYGRETLRAALVRCHEAGQHLFELFVALAACQIGAPDLAVEHAPGLIATVDGPLPAVAQELSTATLCRDGARIEAVSETLEQLGLVLFAAETAGVAAHAHEHAGSARQAIACRVRAQRLLDRCPGADDAFLRRSGRPPALTARELETARHAAMGLSSAQIAKRLVVSTRTVDCHLGRVYVKLGVRGRAELKDHPLLTSVAADIGPAS